MDNGNQSMNNKYLEKIASLSTTFTRYTNSAMLPGKSKLGRIGEHAKAIVNQALNVGNTKSSLNLKRAKDAHTFAGNQYDATLKKIKFSKDMGKTYEQILKENIYADKHTKQRIQDRLHNYYHDFNTYTDRAKGDLKNFSQKASVYGHAAKADELATKGARKTLAATAVAGTGITAGSIALLKKKKTDE